MASMRDKLNFTFYLILVKLKYSQLAATILGQHKSKDYAKNFLKYENQGL